MKQDDEVETIKNFVEILKNIKNIRERRKSSLDRMFWEFNNYNLDIFEDRESKILKYLQEPPTFPRSFLASNLGFNRTTMDSKYNEILNMFRLEKKSTSGSLRNALHFELLKRLIIKYFEKK